MYFCKILIGIIKVKKPKNVLYRFLYCCCSVAKLCLTLWSHRLKPAKLLCPWNVPGKNTGVGCHFVLQEIFPTQGSNAGLLHWQVDSLLLSHLGSPKLLTTIAAKSLQSCSTLRDPIDSSPPGSPVPGIPWARTLEWVTISFSNAWKWKWSRSVVPDS